MSYANPKEEKMKQIITKALKLAAKAAEKGEIPVAAVIFDTATHRILAAAANCTEAKKNACLHAEMLAIAKASKKLDCRYLCGYSIYVTLEPCPMCATAISYSRLDKLIFGASDEKGGGVEHGCKVYDGQKNIWKPEVQSGVESEKCAALLKDFFRKVREKPRNRENKQVRID